MIYWLPDLQWTLLPANTERRCRMKNCRRIAIAQLRRSNGWWAYCKRHLYGRRIANGRIEYPTVLP